MISDIHCSLKFAKHSLSFVFHKFSRTIKIAWYNKKSKAFAGVPVIYIIQGLFPALFLLLQPQCFLCVAPTPDRLCHTVCIPYIYTGETYILGDLNCSLLESNLQTTKKLNTILELFTALIMICKVKLWYIILINGYLCNRTRGLRRRKAINAKSGKKRLILAQLHRSCVSLRTVFELPSYDPVEFSLT